MKSIESMETNNENAPAYILDLKNISNPKGIEKSLEAWKIKKLSERSFVIYGPEIRRIDIIQLYQYVSRNGHVFYFDFQTKGEFYYPKSPMGRKRSVALDSDLDTATVQEIERFLESQPETNEDHQ